jgi:hypothetical protein
MSGSKLGVSKRHIIKITHIIGGGGEIGVGEECVINHLLLFLGHFFSLLATSFGHD